MTYEEAIAYWFGRVNFERTAPNPEDLKLDRMRALLARLGNPHEELRIVHVAGSKGKGSTSAMLAHVLRRAGSRTGLFTSPHLCRVEERIQVDGVSITADELTGLIEEVARAAGPAGESAGLAPTFFEVATAIGFLHFARRRVEAAVLEVGLGGRFDSTNVCRPLVAVITSISFDHMQLLGTRLASITTEKAGIIKPGCVAVSGARAPEARPVIEAVCRERCVPLRQLDRDFGYAFEPGGIRPGDPEAGAGGKPIVIKPRVRIWTERRIWPVMRLGLLGEHQAANAAVAVAVIEHLRDRGFDIDDDAVALGLAGVEWPARMEVMRRHPLVVLDCAHNVASAQALAATLRTAFPPCRRLLVFAASADKDLPGMLRTLAPHFAHVFFTRYQSNPRSAPPEQLGHFLSQGSGLPFTICETPAVALDRALAAAGPDDLVCVTGSVFLAGEVRPLLEPPGNADWDVR